MKRIAILLLAMVSGTLALGQKEPPKPNLNKALNLLRQNKYDEAKAIVEAAITHEKTMNEGKTWFYRGIVYAAMDTSSVYKSTATDNVVVAAQSFKKAEELVGAKLTTLFVTEAGVNKQYTEIKSAFNTKFLLNGDALFKEDKFNEAIIQFEKGLTLNPDSAIYQYAGYAAHNGNDIDKAIEFLGKYVDMGGRNEQALFLRVGSIYEYKKDFEKALTASRDGLKLFPNNVEFRKIELNCLLELKRFDEAITNLTDGLKADPYSVESYYLLGELYIRQPNLDKAKYYYEETVKLDGKHFEANKALAKLNNRGHLGVKEQMKALDYKKDKAKLDALDKEYLVLLKEAVVMWEKCEKLSPDDSDTLDNLLYIYGELDVKDRVDAVTKKMRTLGLLDDN